MSYYAVQNGRSTGVFRDWGSCKSQVDGYSGARYKKFGTMAEAQAFATGQVTRDYQRESSHGRSYGGSRGGNYQRESNYERSYGDTRRSNNSSSYYGREGSNRRATEDHSSQTENYVPKQAQKFYAVKSSNPSVPDEIFQTWGDCQSYVSGKGGLSYRKFENLNDARNFISGYSSKDYDYIGINQQDFKKQYTAPAVERREVKKCNVYCDGSALSNGKTSSRAGYGVYFDDAEGCSISEPLESGPQTNNRAEIQAVSSALDKIWSNLTEDGQSVQYQIKTDSEYVAKLLNDRYMGYDEQKLKELSNSDLVVPLIKKYAKVKQYYEVNQDTFGDTKFHIDWVKGHAGDAGNEMADELARQGASRR